MSEELIDNSIHPEDSSHSAMSRREITKLINNGFPITLSETYVERKKGLLHLFSKPEKKTREVTYIIKELTFNIIDLIALESQGLNLKNYEGKEGLAFNNSISRNDIKIMSKVIALAIMGTDYEYKVITGKREKYIRDEEGLKKIQNHLSQNLHPSDLFGILNLIDIHSNLGDFTNSIGLITGAAKRASLIEEKQPD
ncbi:MULTISPECIES: hypothetical protein [Elizabethkingia]|uniref:Uncharacterized protein n=1 Tax=Elizabethkingia anophelis TaxID=1117645 RepID=A0A494J242_9FLAO|nr:MULTISPECIES: hypothetical protein [Elizabethkingia]AQX52512.1 hypothetical protein AYC66_18315 [Elizabethkingia anophelis]EJC8061932.1 hypothetical protein [Elizabethkingia anophelis]EJK5330567.1 hypothetical protein [Elizabethkingia meningoseptica]MCL1640022.1 hypothetical protein [Elizabethkingia anophelis]MCL1646587.1 hypothetical protein [Elizabethkingia anophelis]